MNKSDPPKKPTQVEDRRTSHPYSANDPIPVPDVTELDSDTAWGLFGELAEPQKKPISLADPFEETVPAELESMVEQPKPAPPKK